MLNEFYRVAFRKRIYGSIAELQEDLDRWCFGKTPMQTFLDAALDSVGSNLARTVEGPASRMKAPPAWPAERSSFEAAKRCAKRRA